MEAQHGPLKPTRLGTVGENTMGNGHCSELVLVPESVGFGAVTGRGDGRVCLYEFKGRD